MLRFTDEHEWLRLEGEVVTVGITQHATEQLGDLVFIELPKLGTRLETGKPAAVVESVKAASDVYAPLAGEVVELNQAVLNDPALVNADPQGAGWLYRLKPANATSFDGFMDETAYAASLA